MSICSPVKLLVVGEAPVDWLVRDRKSSRPGLSLPLGTSSTELGGKASKQEVARGLGRAFSMGNCWEYFSTTRVPSHWLTPGSCSRLRSPPSSFSPASALPFSSQSQLPLGGLGGSECSQPPATSEGQPSLELPASRSH